MVILERASPALLKVWWRSIRFARCFCGPRAASRPRAYRIGPADSRVTRAARWMKVATMRELLEAIVGATLAALRPRASLVAENLALRQQLAVPRRQTSRPQLRPVDRAFWVVLSRTWSRWADALAIVRPATVIGWHRRRFARFWAYKSRRPGRPSLGREVVELIERMATENPMWSRPRIAAELAKLGHDVSKDTVVRYMPKIRRPGRPPSTTWGTFLRTHLAGMLAAVPTVTFDVLHVFFVLSLERRRILHVNVTAHPHAGWTAQQVVEAVDPDGGVLQHRPDGWSIWRQRWGTRRSSCGPHEGLMTAPVQRPARPVFPFAKSCRLSSLSSA
jgi:hypothetical protein